MKHLLFSSFFSCYNTTMNAPIAIGISACLFGQNTRYDGSHRHEPMLVEDLARLADFFTRLNAAAQDIQEKQR